jgi:hypothetical protein
MQRLSWLPRRTTGPRQTRRNLDRKPNPRLRPRLEALEDRRLPSTLTVTSAADDINQRGTLRYDVAHAQSGDTILITPALQGAPIVLTHGELLLTQDVTIEGLSNNPETISGGSTSRVFEVASGAQVSLSNLVLTDGDGVASPGDTSSYAGDGGGILNFGTLSVSNSTISGNSATFDGGGICTFSGAVSFSNCTLTANQCQGGGGAIEDFSPTLTATNSSFVGNTAVYGGGIDTEHEGGTLSVTGCTFVNNQGPANGGALSLITTTTLTNCAFIGNSGAQGGAIFNVDGTLTVSNCTISGNTARYGGGIVSRAGGTLTVLSSNLSDNTATLFGGAIAIGQSVTATVSDTTLSGNTAQLDGGGGIWCQSAFCTLVVDNSTLTGNTAPIGGAIDNNGTLTISTSTLSANTAQEGGGIFNNGGTVTVENSSSITGNTASDLGADVYNLDVLYLDSTSTIGILYGNPPVLI